MMMMVVVVVVMTTMMITIRCRRLMLRLTVGGVLGTSEMPNRDGKKF
jgi:hypothetical protein